MCYQKKKEEREGKKGGEEIEEEQEREKEQGEDEKGRGRGIKEGKQSGG